MALPKSARQRKTNKTRNNGPEARFQREWERVGNLRKRNDKLRAEMDAVLARVRERVLPAELESQATLSALNQRLIEFLSRKTLPEYLRAELIDWIDENLTQMQANPFCPADISAQLAALDAQFANLRAMKIEKLEKKLKQHGFTEQELQQIREEAIHITSPQKQPMDDMFEELFEEVEQGADAADEEADGEEDDWLREYLRQQQARLELRETQLEQLLKATPINGLFRRIARELHPDREIDPTRKLAKHELMTRLIVARDEKDVATIISMYIEHVGEVPEGLFNGDFDKLTELLRHQADKLREEERRIYEENPARARVYEIFDSKNEAELANKVNKYLKALRGFNAWLAQQTASLTSVQRLRAALDERARNNMMDDVGGGYRL